MAPPAAATAHSSHPKNREAVLATYVAAKTKGSGGSPSACTRLYTMGARTTAVVSRENQMVTKVPSRYRSTYSRTPLPPLSLAAWPASQAKTPAWSAA